MVKLKDAASEQATCRLYAILARDGNSAVVFRRGPSRWVALVDLVAQKRYRGRPEACIEQPASRFADGVVDQIERPEPTGVFVAGQ